MRKFITLATAGLFFLSLGSAQAQKEVQPPPVPPMLEGNRPLARPETKEAAPPKQASEEQVKPGAKAKSKTKAQAKAKPKAASKKAAKKKASVTKNGSKHKTTATAKKKPKTKTGKKKHPAAPAVPIEPAGPEEG